MLPASLGSELFRWGWRKVLWTRWQEMCLRRNSERERRRRPLQINWNSTA